MPEVNSAGDGDGPGRFHALPVTHLGARSLSLLVQPLGALVNAAVAQRLAAHEGSVLRAASVTQFDDDDDDDDDEDDDYDYDDDDYDDDDDDDYDDEEEDVDDDDDDDTSAVNNAKSKRRAVLWWLAHTLGRTRSGFDPRTMHVTLGVKMWLSTLGNMYLLWSVVAQ